MDGTFIVRIEIIMVRLLRIAKRGIYSFRQAMRRQAGRTDAVAGCIGSAEQGLMHLESILVSKFTTRRIDMRLYQENAKKLVGKKIDCHRRIFGYFPMTIIEIGGNEAWKTKE